MPEPNNLIGKLFGPLNVVKRWGSQSGNIAWVYFCRLCGHVGKRLGTALKRGASSCPSCRYNSDTPPGKGWPFKRADAKRLAAIMEAAPVKKGRKYPPGFTKRLKDCTTAELSVLLQTVDDELNRRGSESGSEGEGGSP